MVADSSSVGYSFSSFFNRRLKSIGGGLKWIRGEGGLGSLNARQIPCQGIVSPTSVSSLRVDMEFGIPDHPPMMLANQTEARALSGA